MVDLHLKSGLAIYRSLGVLAGVIDQDYTGEVFVLLINHNDKLSYLISPKDKVVQLILEKATIARLQEVDTLDDTERGPWRSTFLKGAVYSVKQKGSGKFERLSRRG